MKSWFPVLLMSLAWPALAADRIEVVRDGRHVAEPPRKALERDLVSLLASCSVESTDWAVKPGTWSHLRKASWRVHLDLVTPMQIHTGAGPVWTTEILVLMRPDTYPGHVYVKLGGTVRAFTKYHPGALLAVGRDPALGLIGTRPYVKLERADAAASNR